jgi:prefoldin subunit 5
MSKLFVFFDQARRLHTQEAELQRLRSEVQKLQHQNERIQTAMRRCVTCDYRLEVIGKKP